MNKYRVVPGEKIKLSDWDPNDKSKFDGDKLQAQRRLEELNYELEALQELLFAEHIHRVLVVLQAMDTGGKDGTIRHVFEGVNPQGVKVASFKVPTREELDHDYLWRVHKHARNEATCQRSGRPIRCRSAPDLGQARQVVGARQ